MAHERIASSDGRMEAVVTWIDDGGVVQLGMVWDGAERPDQPATEDVPTPSNEPLQQAFQDSEGRWSIHMDLPRAHVNGLIRALRRGRNKAYGADE